MQNNNNQLAGDGVSPVSAQAKKTISEKQFRQAIKRILNNESGVYEKVLEHFDSPHDELALLAIIEARRLNGDFIYNYE